MPGDAYEKARGASSALKASSCAWTTASTARVSSEVRSAARAVKAMNRLSASHRKRRRMTVSRLASGPEEAFDQRELLRRVQRRRVPAFRDLDHQRTRAAVAHCVG